MTKIIFTFILTILFSCTGNTQNKKTYKVSKTTQEWKTLLTAKQYYILREAGTERQNSSSLNKNYEKGIYVCAGCKTPLYKSEHKYDSGSGWPAFDSAIKKNVELDIDYKIGYARTELKCNTCGGHLGHSFNDGPKQTTGKRHCVNGASLTFIKSNE
ncbi:peptide-methionine (R)-S-oxide reductase MsrB [Tenacibaculum salmonis]|uniref:peptide-methionine (R)-S-oxide reductase MsrB n=1 Tax=Tenacibaculum sp. P3-BQ1 TaxID=3232310 RepID=UPI0034DE0D9C